MDGWEKNESFLQKIGESEFARRQTVVDWIAYLCLSCLLYSSGGAITQIQL